MISTGWKRLILLFAVVLLPARLWAVEAGTDELAIEHVQLSAARELKVRLQPSESCVFGDIDAILLETRWGGTDGKLLLSLEPLSGDPAKAVPAVLEVPISVLLSTGGEFTLAVPEQKEPGIYGLFICRDSTGARSCRDKEVDEYGNIFGRYAMDVKPGGNLNPLAPESERKKPVPDRNYFFKAVLVEQTAIAFSTKQSSDERALLMAQYLKTLNGGKDYSPDLKREREINKILASLPLQRKADVVEIRLPRIDPDKCERK